MEGRRQRLGLRAGRLDGLFAGCFEKTFFAGVEASTGADTLAGWLRVRSSVSRLGSCGPGVPCAAGAS
eukprot:5688340-Pyramimonas_sp.AAC.1